MNITFLIAFLGGLGIGILPRVKIVWDKGESEFWGIFGLVYSIMSIVFLLIYMMAHVRIV